MCPTAMQNVASKKAIYDIGAEILNLHSFCIMETFLFSKSIIPDENSVKISRRIFLDRSQGLKCTKKTQKFSRSRSLFFLKTQKTQHFSSPRSLYFPKSRKKLKNTTFSHLTNSKFRAGLSGVSSDTPSF